MKKITVDGYEMDTINLKRESLWSFFILAAFTIGYFGGHLVAFIVSL